MDNFHDWSQQLPSFEVFTLFNTIYTLYYLYIIDYMHLCLFYGLKVNPQTSPPANKTALHKPEFERKHNLITKVWSNSSRYEHTTLFQSFHQIKGHLGLQGIKPYLIPNISLLNKLCQNKMADFSIINWTIKFSRTKISLTYCWYFRVLLCLGDLHL